MKLTISSELIAQHDNQDIMMYKLCTPSGFSVAILNYGGIIWEINTPDKNGVFTNVVLNHGKFDPANPDYYGAIIGRVAGRIKDARFKINNNFYQLTANHYANLLHGGGNGLDKRIWAVKVLPNGLELTYFSPDGDNGFPCNVNLTVRYLINEDMQLILEYAADSDGETVLNLTNHSYFNLTGELVNAPRQLLRLASSAYGLIDKEVSFTGEVNSVVNTPFDFNQAKPIGTDLHANHPQINYGKGYDHPFVLNHSQQYPIELTDLVSGRYLKIDTQEPVVVVYSGNYNSVPWSAVCLETQRMPNAINLAKYRDSVICSPNRPYVSRNVWQFGVLE
ncbi:MAG: galactose mutarotase [Proteobacteria bacterium]|nr:MAG: galactose mutarotase [Pseudomonadota bacterium]